MLASPASKLTLTGLPFFQTTAKGNFAIPIDKKFNIFQFHCFFHHRYDF